MKHCCLGKPPHVDLKKHVLLNRAATKRPRNEALWLFTHPIFESDFDCLTGKNRLHADSFLSLSPLTNKNTTETSDSRLHERVRNVFHWRIAVTKSFIRTSVLQRVEIALLLGASCYVHLFNFLTLASSQLDKHVISRMLINNKNRNRPVCSWMKIFTKFWLYRWGKRTRVLSGVFLVGCFVVSILNLGLRDWQFGIEQLPVALLLSRLWLPLGHIQLLADLLSLFPAWLAANRKGPGLLFADDFCDSVPADANEKVLNYVFWSVIYFRTHFVSQPTIECRR